MRHAIELRPLKSGATLLAIRVPNAISAAFNIHLRSGTRFCAEEEYEVSHLLEHMVFEGNKKIPDPQKFKYEVEKNGAYVNALTGRDQNEYVYTTIPEHLPEISEIAFSQVYEPLIREKQVLEQREVIASELNRSLVNPSFLCNYRALQALLPRLPDLERRIEVVKQLEPETLRQFHATFYEPSNSFIVLAGDISDSQVEAIIGPFEQRLQSLPPGQRQEFIPIKLPKDYARQVNIFDSELQTHAQFSLTFIKEGLDRDAHLRLRMLSAMASGGLSSRLMLKCREAGLSYTIRTAASTDIDSTELGLDDQSTPEKLTPLFAMAVGELADLASGGFSEDEFTRAKGYIVGGFKRSHETPTSLANWYGVDLMRGDELIDPIDFSNMLAAVTRDEIIEYAGKYLRHDTWNLTMMGKSLLGREAEFTAILDKHFPE